MGTSLNGLTPAGTYPGLIKTGDNAPIDGTLKTLSDGNGNNLPMSVSTTTINLTGTAQVGGVAIANTTQVAAKQDTLVSGTNIKTINGTSLLGSGNIPVVTSPSGVAGAIQFSNGSAFASDATNLFWDDTNNWLGIGTNAPATALDLRGSLTIQRDATNFTMRLGSLGQINAYIDASTNNQFYLVDATFSNSFILNNLGTGFGVSPIASTKVAIKGSGSTSATTSLLVQNSSGVASLQVTDDGSVFNYGKGAVTTNTVFGKSALNANTSGSNNTAIGAEALLSNTTGTRNTAVGFNPLTSNISGNNNVAIGNGALYNNSTGSNNTAIGYDALSGNFSGSVILGKDAVATGNNQFVVGSVGTNAGAIDSSAFIQDKRWKVKINGVDYYIALQTA